MSRRSAPMNTDEKQLPEGWECRRLSELFIIRPQKKQVKEKLYDTDEVSFVPMECLNVHDKNLTLNQTRTLSDVYSGYTYFEDNDVLLAKITPCFENGKVGIANNLINGVGFGSSEFIVFRSQGKVIPEYLYYYLSQVSFRREGKIMMAGAVGHKRVSKDFINEYKLPFPESIQEQKRIVAIFDEAFASIDKAKANAENNLANAKELFDSYLNGIFANPGENWEEKKLGEIGKIQTGTTPKTSVKEYFGDYIPFIKPADIYEDGNIDFVKQGLSKEGLKVGRNIPKDSILMVCIGASIGKVGYSKRNVSCNQQINTLTTHKKLVSKIIYYAMTSTTFQSKVINSGKSSQATLPIINKTKWSNLKLNIPKDTEKQKLIVAQLDKLSAETKKLESIYQQKISALDELKKSILKKAFEGEL